MVPSASDKPETHPHKPPPRAERNAASLWGLRQFIADYFWFILKNVIGWIFILSSPLLGIAVPGPGGIPVFLIGFALVTFPGKRKLTSRVMRGVTVHVDPAFLTFLVTVVSVLVTAGLLWFVAAKYDELLKSLNLKYSIFQLLGVCALAAGVTWLAMRIVLVVVNFILKRLPMIRRKVRPWLRKKGINLLPPRRRREQRLGALAQDRPADEVVEFHESYHRNLKGVWLFLRSWLKRVFAVGVTVAIFWAILIPIRKGWSDPEVQARLQRIDVIAFLLSAAMFAFFLFAFRALGWRHILAKMGFKLPVAPAVRIWSTSELARYVPGAVFQVIGRVYLTKPYGVRGSITSVTQILELTIFLLANVIVAVACLMYFGVKNLTGAARTWMLVASALVPVLTLLLHPRVCYGIVNWVMARLRKPPMARPLSGIQMFGILIWNIVGLLWQSLAVYLLLHDVLELKLAWWWIVAGSYCLAWVAGFLAVWAPAGIGVRELVFVAAMHAILPEHARAHIGDRPDNLAILGVLSLLLRVWATLGELLLAATAYALDWRGAIGRPDAFGRVSDAELVSSHEPTSTDARSAVKW